MESVCPTITIWGMKRRRPGVKNALGIIAFTSVALAFQLTTRCPQVTYRHTSWGAVTLKPESLRLNPDLRRLPSKCRPERTYGGALVMMGRANRQRAIRAEEKRRENDAPVVLSAKDRRRANRARRAYYREKFASSSRRLIRLQKEDEDSFYIGFVGTNRAGRAAALRAVEVFLKKATELKVAKYYKDDATIKLVDAGSRRLPEMIRTDEHKLSLLRRCDLLVHVVRCFDLEAPEPRAPEGAIAIAEAVPAAKRALRGVQGIEEVEETEGVGDDVEWPLSPTPLEDIKSARADMAYADLHFIEERQKSNHTRWFWRDRRRAYNERTALELVTPALEDAYAGDGELNPPGIGFRNSCLRDEPSVNGTVIYRNRLRAAIQEIGFITPKPVVYAANLPPEASPAEESGDEDRDASNINLAESAASIAKVARAHGEKVIDLKRDYGVPAVMASLMTRDGQESLGATVFKSIPRSILNRDPKLKKAIKSAASKAQRQRSFRRDPDAGREPRANSSVNQAGRAAVPV